jgi:hypothetical protein
VSTNILTTRDLLETDGGYFEHILQNKGSCTALVNAGQDIAQATGAEQKLIVPKADRAAQ